MTPERPKPAKREFREIQLGGPDRPYPMWGTVAIEHDGKVDLEQALSVISPETPMSIWSERPYEEVIAIAYCDMPTPSLLPLFKKGLEQRAPDSDNRVQMVIGDPGQGKSFLGTLHWRLRSKESAEVYDAGGRNLKDLVFETVIDYGAGDPLPKAIDRRARAGTLQDMTLGLIRQFDSLEAMPEAYAGKPEAEAEWREKNRVVTWLDDNRPAIDWKKLREGSAEKVGRAFDLLKRISAVESLDDQGGNALGVNSQYGPVIRWWLENREGVIDEYNKSIDGTDNALQTFWQFQTGEIREVTIENVLKNKDGFSGPSSFTFKASERGDGFALTLTGNRKEDGITTHSLSESAYDRLQPDTLPNPTLMDWQHRISQLMTGMPVTTLYTMFKKHTDMDPDKHQDEFGEWLLTQRRNKAKADGTTVPELQETLLLNWKNTVNAVNKLSRFYKLWADMTDEENLPNNGHADLMNEVDEEYSKKEGMSFRRIRSHMQWAVPIRPHIQSPDARVPASFKGWGKAPARVEKQEESPALGFGTRLVEFLENTVYEKTAAVGKKNLYSKLTKAMQEIGLRDIHLAEGAKSSQKSVEDDLNISQFRSPDPGVQARLARKVFVDYLRQADPEIDADSDEKVVTLGRFRRVLEEVAAKETKETKEVFVVNRDHASLQREPLASATVRDLAAYVAPGDGRAEVELDFYPEDIVHHDDFMASLALPTVGAKNLTAVWESNLRALVGESPAAGPRPDDRDEAMRMAENRSASGLAVTSLHLRAGAPGGEHEVPVHIVRNAERNKTLVVGESLPSKLRAAFREAGIAYVDRNDPNARAKTEDALRQLTRGVKMEGVPANDPGQPPPPSVRDTLADAFSYRSRVETEDHQNRGARLAEALLNPAPETPYPKYVVRNARRAP